MYVFERGFLLETYWIDVILPVEIVKYIKDIFEQVKRNCRYRYETDNSLHPK